MRTLATPAEFENLMASLDHIDVERRASIARMVFKVVADCPRCDEPVRRCDPRRLIADQLLHLSCVGDAADGGGRAGGKGGAG